MHAPVKKNRSMVVLLWSIAIVMGALLGETVAAQNTGDIISPRVLSDHRALRYRSTCNPDTNALRQRLQCEAALTGSEVTQR